MLTNDNIKPYGFIYITTNIVNGKKYIGQRKFNYGWNSYLGSGQLLKQAIQKYGRNNFEREILKIAYSQDELNAFEITYINHYNATKNNEFYNIADGGKSGNKFSGKSKEQMNIIISKRSEKKHWKETLRVTKRKNENFTKWKNNLN